MTLGRGKAQQLICSQLLAQYWNGSGLAMRAGMGWLGMAWQGGKAS